MVRAKKNIILLMILTSVMVLSGCDKIRFNTFKGSEDDKKISSEEKTELEDREKNDSPKSSESAQEDANVKIAVNTGDSTEEAKPTPTPIQPIANRELMIYSIDVASGDKKTVTALVLENQEITPEVIVDLVVEALADESISIGIEKVSTEGDAVIVSFFSDQAPVINLGSGYEGAVLDVIAQSLIDNLDDYGKVIYRVEGKAYVSGHIELGIDEVYLGD
ncbi:MAG TPA: hypothetical protein GXZ28_05695 [Clostridiales bacterium]|jgi:hypothetical protein|nr:hypothetical protein [Clostridiales bacterium]